MESNATRRRQRSPLSPKRLVREQVGIVHGPIIGCEYKAVKRQHATAGAETSSEPRGLLEVDDIVFPVEARPCRGVWRMRLVLGEGREVWVSELTEDGTPLLEMVTASAALEEGQPPMRIPDVESSVGSTPVAPLPTSPAMRPGLSPSPLSASTPPRLMRDVDREDQESVMNEAIARSLALGATGRSAVANFLPLRDFLRQEVHRLCEAVQDAEKQAEEEAKRRHTLEQQLSTSQHTKELLQSEMSLKIQAAAAEAAREKQSRESLQSQLRELQEAEGSLRVKLREEIAIADQKAEAERLEREAVQARLAEVQAAERCSREELGRDVLAAQARADAERKRRETVEEQIETVKSEQDKRAVKLRDAVAYAESQLMRERNSREDLQRQLSDQQQQEAEKRNSALAAVAEAETAAASERQQRELLQQTLERARVENEQQAAELRAQISRAEQDANAERSDRQAKDRELQALKATHNKNLESLRAKLEEAEKLAEGEKKLRQSIETTIADARNLSHSDVAAIEDKLQQAKRDIDRERLQRQSAEEKLERVSAEENERALNLSQMLQVLSNEVRAARAEVETLRASNNTADTSEQRDHQQQLKASPGAMTSLETWMDHTNVHADRVDTGSTENLAPSQLPDGDSENALSELRESHEALKQDAETLKQRLVSALQENHEKSEKLREERAKRKELRAELEKQTAEEIGQAPDTLPLHSNATEAVVDDSNDGAAAVDVTVAAMLAAAEESAVAHHDKLADEIATHMTEHAAQQARSEEKLLKRLQISGDALAQAINQCKATSDAAKVMQTLLGELTRERDDALQEVIEFKRELETIKARERSSLAEQKRAKLEQASAAKESLQAQEAEGLKWQHRCQEAETQVNVLRQQLQESLNSVQSLAAERDELAAQVEVRVAAVEEDKFAATDFSPAKSRELRRELRELREIADSRKLELDQRVDELARLEAEREKYVANLSEKNDEMESLKDVHAEEVKTLHDQLMAKQDKYTQNEREQEERYASSLAEAEARTQAAWEERDRVSTERAGERSRAEERLRRATERYNAAMAQNDALVAELDQWVTLSHQPVLRAAVVSHGDSPRPTCDDVSMNSLPPGPSTVGDILDDIGAVQAEASSSSFDHRQQHGQSLVPASPVESEPSVYGGWLTPSSTPAILEGRDGEEGEGEGEGEDEDEDEHDEVNAVATGFEEDDEPLAGLYRLGSSLGLDQDTIDDALEAFEDDFEACAEYLTRHGSELAAELIALVSADPGDNETDASLNSSLE